MNVLVDRDPSAQFMEKQNRELMFSLTAMQIDRVFQIRPKPYERPTYQFLTVEQLKAKFDGALRTAKRLLLMPPIVPIAHDNIQILSKDPEIQGYSEAKFVFTDTSLNVPDRDRMVLIRHPNGVLETADQLTRRRMCQTYFPFAGRRIAVPRMFCGEHLQRCLDDGKYLFVLDRCVIQFEPYEYDYHRIMCTTYQHINHHSAFDTVRSTRHFGPMAFFLAWHHQIDNLIIDCIRRDLLRNAVDAICLMFNLNKIPYDAYILEQMKTYPKRDDEHFYRQLIHSKGNDIRLEIEKQATKTATDLKCDEICLQFLDDYCKSKAEHIKKPNEIAAALQTYREHAEEKRRLLEGLQKAHGIN